MCYRSGQREKAFFWGPCLPRGTFISSTMIVMMIAIIPLLNDSNQLLPVAPFVMG